MESTCAIQTHKAHMNKVHANHPVNGSSAVWHFEINADIRAAVAFKGLKLVAATMQTFIRLRVEMEAKISSQVD